MFRQSNLAQNLKKYRRLRNLTQSELAEKLFVTAQNVSKWETGKSVPDLDNLCKLAEVFAVSPDRLLRDTQSTSETQLLIAIDGGGTKTEFILFTAQGTILKRLMLGGCNPNTVGLTRTQALLQSGLDQLLAANLNVGVVYAGIAGCGIKVNQQSIQTFLEKNYPAIRFSIASDVPNVIYSAPVEERCIAVICGTGSVVFAKTPDQMHRVGGWGSLWESGCSGYDFGRDALGAALAARDGIGPQTVLLELAEERLGGNITEKIADIYRLNQDGIARYSDLVFLAYARQDEVAAQILDKNARQLAQLINTAARNYDCGTDVVAAGGLTAQETVLRLFLKDKLHPELKLIFNPMPQICGAAVGASRMLDQQEPGFLDKFYVNYKTFTEDESNA